MSYCKKCEFHKNPVICVTGPMAAGKNIASEILSRYGFACVDADFVAHQALELATDKILLLHKDNAKKYGVNLLNSDGSLNRKSIAKIVFSDSNALKAHEALVHPIINDLLYKFIDEHKDVPVVLNATVLYKTPLINCCDKILFIDAPCFIRFFRAKKRDNMTFSQIFARFSSQKNIFAKYKKLNADIYKVWNIGNSYSLERKIKRILLQWNRNEFCGLLQQ